MARKLKNPLIRPKARRSRTVRGKQSAGIMDDYALRKTVNTRQGTVDQTPLVAKDLANKEYVDAQIAGENHWDDDGTYLHPYIDARGAYIKGNVGIGTASPVVVGAGSKGIQINAPTGKIASLYLTTDDTGSTNSDGFSFEMRATEGILNLRENLPLNFRTNNTDRLTILGDGKVGIGTSSPDQELYVRGSSGHTRIQIDGASGSDGQILFSDGDVDQWLLYSDTSDSDKFKFLNSGITPITMQTDGNVGIGTTSPDELLHVYSATGDSKLKIQGATYNWSLGLDSGSANFDFKYADSDIMTVKYTGEVGIGTTSPTAKAHIDQSSTTAAIPVLTLDQADISEEIVSFETTIGTGNPIEAVAAKTLTTTHFIKVKIPGGLIRYIPIGTIA